MKNSGTMVMLNKIKILSMLLLQFYLLIPLQAADDLKPDKPVPWDYELKAEAFDQFRKIYDRWFKHQYGKLLKKHGIKLNCDSCEYAYLVVELEIGKEGRVLSLTAIDSNICGKKAKKLLFEDFLRYFKKRRYPPPLRKLKFRTRLGTGLTC